jgi:hypothetical protein
MHKAAVASYMYMHPVPGVYTTRARARVCVCVCMWRGVWHAFRFALSFLLLPVLAELAALSAAMTSGRPVPRRPWMCTRRCSAKAASAAAARASSRPGGSAYLSRICTLWQTPACRRNRACSPCPKCSHRESFARRQQGSPWLYDVCVCAVVEEAGRVCGGRRARGRNVMIHYRKLALMTLSLRSDAMGSDRQSESEQEKSSTKSQGSSTCQCLRSRRGGGSPVGLPNVVA